MDKLGTWLAVSAVAVGFVILVWLLFADNPKDNKKKKMKKQGGRCGKRLSQ